MSGWAAAAQVGAEIGLGQYNRRKQESFNKWQAREQRAWQERMSRNAYQYAAEDLEKAGLNRILAIGNGATVPGGASAQATQADSNVSYLEKRLIQEQTASAKEAQKVAQEDVAMKKSIGRLNDAQAQKVINETVGVQADNELKKLDAEMYSSDFGVVMRLANMFGFNANQIGRMFGKGLKGKGK